MLISASQALDMMSAHAPRPWAKRVLSWQIYLGVVQLYFASGRITELRSKLDLLLDSDIDPKSRLAGDYSDFDVEISTQLEKANNMDRISVRTDTWADDPKSFPINILVYADIADWELGRVKGRYDRFSLSDVDDVEELTRESESSELDVELKDMCFLLDEIEMLAPNGAAPKGNQLSLSVGDAQAPPLGLGGRAGAGNTIGRARYSI